MLKLTLHQQEMLRSLVDGRSRRVGGHRKLGEASTRDALARRGLIEDNDHGDFWISDAGRATLAALDNPSGKRLVQPPYRIASSILEQVPIPADVIAFTEKSWVDISRNGIQHLPFPLNTATIWIGCEQAWPHEDPDFEGLLFITLTIRGDHVYRQCQPGDTHLSHTVFPGTVFTTDPLATHWLQPSDLSAAPQGFIGLQWEIPTWDYEARHKQLLKDLEHLGRASRISTETLPAILEPSEE